MNNFLINSSLENLKYKRIEISFPLRSFFGKYPLLFYSLYGLVPKNRMLSVNRNTQLVIEGFPRSANTFAVATFNEAQSEKLRLAHHMHVPAQIIRGVRWKIPTIILIRNPKDAVVSFAMYDQKISINQALKCYVSFYKSIYPYRSECVIASFEEVINNYSSVIRETNNKFGTKFISLTPTGSELKSIFQKIESVGNIEAIRQGETECSELNIARPSSTRAFLKRELIQKLKEPQNHKILKDAEKIYSEFMLSRF